MKNNRVRIVWSFICSVAVVTGIIDFYLNWIRKIKIENIMQTHFFLIIGIIGAIALISLFVYWKISDFIIWQKSEIKNLKNQNYQLIEAINNHADCLNIKVSRTSELIEGSASFSKKIEQIIPKKININELNRDNKQLS